MGQKNEHQWGESSAIVPEFFKWHPAKASDHKYGKMPYVYISDKRIEELQRDIKELKDKVDNIERKLSTRENESLLTMLASEAVLSKDWDAPEEEKAWADL